jgi:hypothetical protein
MTTIRELMARSGYERPTTAELRRLREIVYAAHPDVADGSSIEMFDDAMWAAGHFGRTVVPWSGAFFSFWVERAADLLERAGRPACTGPSFLSAVIAHGDITYRLPDRFKGQLIELGLSAYSGAPCRNAWRRVLNGQQALLAPTPSERKAHPLTVVHGQEPYQF